MLTALRVDRWVPAAAAARALARELLPDEDPCPAPDWLLPDQVRSFRRVVAALRRYRGALLADPVGSGKTYVALAAASALDPRRAAACIVPAALLSQWHATAQALGLPISLLSHEQASRGHLPWQDHPVVVIDEAHRFRNPRGRRYRHLAPWLVGRTTLLVTATPVVNRLADLLHQLLLAVRDDALLPDGVPSLRALLYAGAGAPALGRLVVERTGRVAAPERGERVSRPGADDEAAADAALALIERLSLSRSEPIAALVRTVLRHAAGSSPAALAGALRRYRRLLLHARDALAAGRPMDRAELRRFTGESPDQLVMWALLPPCSSDPELELADLDTLEEALAEARRRVGERDPKVERLRQLLEDGAPTLVFVARRETVRHLRDRLGDRRLAWCTGRHAGLGPAPLPRPAVLGWFREGPGAAEAERLGIRHLVVTDVAAEGLDLQRAARVVHYDLPWTPMRLEQREGRVIRLGSRHRSVEVVRFALPRGLERGLRIEWALRRKRTLPGTAGLGPAGRRLWRWRTELGEALSGGPAEAGAAVVPAGPRGALVGFTLHARREAGDARLVGVVGWLDPDGGWTEHEETVAARLAAAAGSSAGVLQAPDALRAALAQLADPVRGRLADLSERRWAEGHCEGAARVVAAALQDGIRAAARRRDAAALEALERALGFVAGGHSAGEAMLLERLAAARPPELMRAAARLPPPTPRWGPVEARLTGVVLFAPPDG